MKKIMIKLKISWSNTMLNYGLSQKLKLLENGKFNYLIIYFYPLSSKVDFFSLGTF